MPDLNLQDDSSLENVEGAGESQEEATTPQEEPAKKGGGMTTIIVVVLAVLIVGGGGAFLLNKLGVIHIFGPKKPAPTVVQLQEQQAGVSTPSSETAQAPPIETPPVESKGKGGAATKTEAKNVAKPGAKEKPTQPMKEMPAPMTSAKLQEMKGEYTVQVSAWKDKEMAGEIAKRLEDAGYPAFVQDRQYSGSTWYTVRVGRYASRKEAETAVQSFAEELRSNYWIDKAK